jgi:predicted DNA-binding transcriptional regulator YafY
MAAQSSKINKTERILSVYHLLTHCEEVSWKEFSDLLPGCKKTFSRDIALLKKVGVPVRYSARRRAFVLADREGVSLELPNGKSARRFAEKLIRLVTTMNGIPDADCDQWYERTFPQGSKRTMQRDFAILNAIGYNIKYERACFSNHDAGFDLPPRRYYCDRPLDAYSLTTFDYRKGF